MRQTSKTLRLTCITFDIISDVMWHKAINVASDVLLLTFSSSSGVLFNSYLKPKQSL